MGFLRCQIVSAPEGVYESSLAARVSWICLPNRAGRTSPRRGLSWTREKSQTSDTSLFQSLTMVMLPLGELSEDPPLSDFPTEVFEQWMYHTRGCPPPARVPSSHV